MLDISTLFAYVSAFSEVFLSTGVLHLKKIHSLNIYTHMQMKFKRNHPSVVYVYICTRVSFIKMSVSGVLCWSLLSPPSFPFIGRYQDQTLRLKMSICIECMCVCVCVFVYVHVYVSMILFTLLLLEALPWSVNLIMHVCSTLFVCLVRSLVYTYRHLCCDLCLFSLALPPVSLWTAQPYKLVVNAAIYPHLKTK